MAEANPTALVTGATSGIGEQTALRPAARALHDVALQGRLSDDAAERWGLEMVAPAPR